MKKKYYFICLLLTSVVNFSQEKIITFENSLKESSSAIKDVIPIVNSKNGDIVYFIADAKNVYAYEISSEFKVSRKIKSEEKRRKYKILIGYGVDSNNNYDVFLTNKSKNSFLKLNFSFKDNLVTSKEFTLNSDERFVQTTTINNTFYLIAKATNKDEIYAHTFEGDNIIRNKISTKNIRFVNSINEGKKTRDILNSEIKKYEENVPNSIEITSNDVKMYEKENGVLFSYNKNDSYTQLLFVDLLNFKASSKAFKNALEDVKNQKKKSNSYVNGNYLFSFSISKEIFEIKIIDITSENLVKKYSVSKDDEITFKNTPIIQEGGVYDGYRELKKTKQFFRKVYAGNVGISVKEYDKFYHISTGGYIVQRGGGMMMMPMGGMGGFAIGSVGNATIFFNPTLFAFNSYGNNKSTRFESLFDKNFEHVTGEIPRNAFDKMKSYKSNNKGGTVFKYKDYYIKTKYNPFSKEVVFMQFND